MSLRISLTIATILTISAVGIEFTHADSFGSGDDQFELEFVTIGNPGNQTDDYGFGGVTYEYRIGKYEVHQGALFAANRLGELGLEFGRSEKDWQKLEEEPLKPVNNASWDDAARFVNWLNTDSGSVPAYKFDESNEFQLWQPVDPGYDPDNLFRNRLAKYFLPSADEWHKAAYYDPNKTGGAGYYMYPTGSDSPPDGIDFRTDAEFEAVFIEKEFDRYWQVDPRDVTDVGVLSPYGTGGQGGNVWEMQETEWDLVNDYYFDVNTNYYPNDKDYRVLRIKGGGLGGPGSLGLNGLWIRDWADTGPYGPNLGFRVASRIPEPTTLILALTAFAGIRSSRRMQ